MSAKVDFYHFSTQDRLADGHRICLRIYIRPNHHYITTGVRVHINQWDKARGCVINHPNAKLLNAKLQKLKNEMQALILQEEIMGNPVTPMIFKGTDESFEKYAKSVRGDTSETKTHLSRIKKYLGREPKLNEITSEWLRKFEKWMEEKEYDNNTINGAGKFFSRVMRQAKKDRKINYCPFEDGGHKVRTYIQPDTIYLDEIERQKFVDLLLSGKVADEREYMALTYFLIACYTGFRHSDWASVDPKTRVYKVLNHETGKHETRIRLRAMKNKDWVAIQVGPTLAKLLNIAERIGLCNLSNNDCNTLLRDINTREEITGKYLSCHVARHSFGYWCATLGYSELLTAKLLGIGLTAVKVYFHLTGNNITKQAKAMAEA